MKTISATSQKGQHFIKAYERSSMYSIYDAYKKPSQAKIDVYSYWLYVARKDKIDNYKIIGASCSTFSVAWRIAEGLRVETAYNSYLVK